MAKQTFYNVLKDYFKTGDKILDAYAIKSLKKKETKKQNKKENTK